MDRLVDYPAPIVAAVQGDAYGGAVELLACADLRVAATGVRLGVPPVRLGLVYSHTGLRRLLRGFGSPLVREMLLTGEAISAERAHRWASSTGWCRRRTWRSRPRRCWRRSPGAGPPRCAARGAS